MVNELANWMDSDMIAAMDETLQGNKIGAPPALTPKQRGTLRKARAILIRYLIKELGVSDQTIRREMRIDSPDPDWQAEWSDEWPFDKGAKK